MQRWSVMSHAWQQFVVAVVVAACAMYLAFRAWRMMAGRQRGCGAGCGKCGSQSPVVSVDALRSSAER